MTKTQPITPAIAERFVALYDEVARDELEALSGVGAVAAINRAAERSVYTFAGLKDGEPLFLGGVNSEGQVWMLGGPGIAGAKKFYLRETRRQTEIMQAMFPRLWTCVALVVGVSCLELPGVG